MDGEKELQKAYKSILDHDFEKAIEWFEQAVERDPDNAANHYKLSITYGRSNKLAKALEHAGRALELAPDHEPYRFHVQNLLAKEKAAQAQKCLEEGRDQLFMAVSLLRDAVSLDALCTEAYLLLAVAYAELDENFRAVQTLWELLKLDPQNAEAMKLLKQLQSKMKQYIESG
jgi:tetratricopeptide (TPR) repeat protein